MLTKRMYSTLVKEIEKKQAVLDGQSAKTEALKKDLESLNKMKTDHEAELAKNPPAEKKVNVKAPKEATPAAATPAPAAAGSKPQHHGGKAA